MIEKDKIITPQRIQRSRQSKQVSPNGLPIVYVGRPTKFGNPFIVFKNSPGDWDVQTSNPNGMPNIQILIANKKIINTKKDAIDVAVECFSEYIKTLYNWDINIKELKGKNLSCWCRLDCKCHADVLLELANNK